MHKAVCCDVYRYSSFDQ